MAFFINALSPVYQSRIYFFMALQGLDVEVLRKRGAIAVEARRLLILYPGGGWVQVMLSLQELYPFFADLILAQSALPKSCLYLTTLAAVAQAMGPFVREPAPGQPSLYLL